MSKRKLPANIHKLKGNYRPSRHGTIDEKPAAIAMAKPLKCPAWLSADAKKEWKRIMNILGALNVLAQTDHACLAQYCELFAEFKGAPRDFPAAKHTQLRLLLQELGFTPSTREKLDFNTEPESSEPEPWEKF